MSTASPEETCIPLSEAPTSRGASNARAILSRRLRAAEQALATELGLANEDRAFLARRLERVRAALDTESVDDPHDAQHWTAEAAFYAMERATGSRPGLGWVLQLLDLEWANFLRSRDEGNERPLRQAS